MLFQKLTNSQWLRLLLVVLFSAKMPLALSSPKPVKTTKTSVETQLEKQDLSPKMAAKKLNWVVDQQHCPLCGGYFYQSQALKDDPSPQPFRTQVTHVIARGPTTFHQNGVSVATGGVIVTQPGRRLSANKAFIYHDARAGRVTYITLVGDVHFWQYQRLIVGTRAHIDMVHHTIRIKHALYHMGPVQADKRVQYNAWGYAGQIHNPSQMIINLKRATYSTCSPLHQFWRLSLKRLHLDRDRGVGTAHHAVFRIKGVPVFYAPYLSFPIDNRRKTGFLMPTYMHSKINKDKSGPGSAIGFPFYWNIAPNYDTTITPFYNIERGFRIDDLTRYLNKFGSFNLNLSFLPQDKTFSDYRRETINEFSNDASLAPYVNALRKMHNYRGYIALNGTQKWNELWSSDLNLNYVSDPYFFRDVSQAESFFDPNQLINQFDVKYNGDHWQAVGLLQAYQTLHRIDQFNLSTQDQYQRLPEFDVGGAYPDIWQDLGLNLSTQLVDFDFDSDFPIDNKPVGWRFHARPSMNYDYIWRGGYINPSIYLDATSYVSEFKQTTSNPQQADLDATRVMPLVDLDTGLYFDRSFHWGQKNYRQTLEPRLFYLYVPYENQDKYPVFDTQLLPFSTQQLFSLNRYNGFDRLENANQASVGFTSRIMRGDDGAEILKADLGMIYYISDPKVALPGVTLTHESWSPIIGDITYDLSHDWSLGSQAAWDPEQSHLNNASASVHYVGEHNQTFSIGYQYVFDQGSDSLGLSNTTQQLITGLSWPLFYRWSTFGYVDYEFNRKRPEMYFAGLEYSSCCWALRFIANRKWTGVNPNSTMGNVKNQYNNQYMVQLLFKGLSSVGSTSESALLKNISGYTDDFSKTN